VFKIQILKAGGVKTANMRRLANFCGDRSNRCRVIAFLLLLRFMTLTFDILTSDSGHAWQIA